MHQEGSLNRARSCGWLLLSLLLASGCTEDRRAIDVACGAAHSCALDDSGQVWCWGAGVREPERVTGLPSVTDISAGQGHTCALATDDSVWCWGSGERGQLGTGTESSSAPGRVPGVAATAIAAGDLHTCALHDDGVVSCWGDNSTGQLGAPSSASPMATPVVATDGAAAIAAGGIDGVSRSCALRGGEVWCWGRLETEPVATGVAGAKQIDVGADHFCAVLVDGSLACVDAFEDAALAQLEARRWRAVSAGGLHTCVLGEDGAVWCFGNDLDGQLGDGDADASGTAVRALDGAVAVEAGALHSCAVLESGAVQCWGENNNGRLGNGEAGRAETSPVRVMGFGE